MKHLLNDLTEQEKNSIREQHTGGMKVMTENFSKLVNSKLGDVKPLVSEQTQALPSSGTTSGDTTTNPFKNPDLLKKYVGKQFNVYDPIEKRNKPDRIGYNYSTFEIKKAYFDDLYDVTFEVDTKGSDSGEKKYEASFDCSNPDQLFMSYDDPNIDGNKKSYWTAFAPSLIKELKQTFCTVGADNQIVPKVDYPTP